MLEYEELEELIEKITAKITLANRTGTLTELLKSWGLSDLLYHKTAYETEKSGKIVVIGGTEVKEAILLGIAKKLGIDKNRFEFCLDYGKTKTYPYQKLRYSPEYRVVLFGPTPHSSTGKGESSSVITEMRTHEGYPRVEVLTANNKNKITKNNFECALTSLVKEHYI